MSKAPSARSTNSVAISRSGFLYKYEAIAGSTGNWLRLYSILQGHKLFFHTSDTKDEAAEPKEIADLEDATVTSPDAGKVARRFAMDITTKVSLYSLNSFIKSLLTYFFILSSLLNFIHFLHHIYSLGFYTSSVLIIVKI
jgi:hypothetical protein